MRFACQSCGKAYNLPEEKIADKSNVKLKCRVCGAIVEVKRQGEVVAAILNEENKRGRVSEAPAPLTSMMPDDSDDATHAIAVGDQILSESSGEDAAAALMGHVKSALGQRGLGEPLPPPSPTGFASPPAGAFVAPAFNAATPGAFGAAASPNFAPTPVPPPLSAPDLPRADALPTFTRPDAVVAPPLPTSSSAGGTGSPPPPLPNADSGLYAAGVQNSGFQNSGFQNGSNGAAARFAEAAMSDEALPPVAMAAGGAAAFSPALAAGGAEASYSGANYSGSLDMSPPAQASDTTRKMLAALATGILIGFIIARLFF